MHVAPCERRLIESTTVSASRPEVIDPYSAAHKGKNLWEENYPADPLAKAVEI